MWLHLGIVASLFVLAASFPADTGPTLHERYGRPISETYLVRPGIVASARYGGSGHVCEIVLSPRKPSSLIKSGQLHDRVQGVDRSLRRTRAAERKGQVFDWNVRQHNVPPRQ
jgi:hypothetical protein